LLTVLLLAFINMSSTLDRLVPILDGTNYREWSTLMQAYLRMQDLWDVVSGASSPPTKPTGIIRDVAATETEAARRIRIPPSQEELDVYQALWGPWSKEDNKALGAITLRLTPNLRHHLAATSRTSWDNLLAAFGVPSQSAAFADFTQVVNIKLSGNNPIPEMERMQTLFGRLDTAGYEFTDRFEAMLLLAALPAKWDSVAQLFMQRTNLTAALTFATVRTAITAEYERSRRPIDHSANRLSAVKRNCRSSSHRLDHRVHPTSSSSKAGSTPLPRRRNAVEASRSVKSGRNAKEKPDRLTTRISLVPLTLWKSSSQKQLLP